MNRPVPSENSTQFPVDTGAAPQYMVTIRRRYRSSGETAASDPSGGISVFDAVEKELGLKLVKQTRSIPVIVVDHIDEKPIE